jgi:hypothetical protein
MGKHALGLHTKKEQNAALYHARAVVSTALEVENRSTLTYAVGYLQAIFDISREEGADDLSEEVGGMILDLRNRLENV